MDTRGKIIDATHASAIAASGATVVSGYFDPLFAAQAERLAALKPAGAKLLVLIATPEDPILSAGARAQLVAGLRAVDYVAEASDGLTAQIHLEGEDRQAFSALRERVRQTCAS